MLNGQEDPSLMEFRLVLAKTKRAKSKIWGEPGPTFAHNCAISANTVNFLFCVFSIASMYNFLCLQIALLMQQFGECEAETKKAIEAQGPDNKNVHILLQKYMCGKGN